MHLIVKVLQDFKIFTILGHKNLIEISVRISLYYYLSHRLYKAQDVTI